MYQLVEEHQVDTLSHLILTTSTESTEWGIDCGIWDSSLTHFVVKIRCDSVSTSCSSTNWYIQKKALVIILFKDFFGILFHMLFHFLFIFIFTQVGIWVCEQIPAFLPFTLEKKANRSSDCIKSSFPVIKIDNPFSCISQSFVDIDGSFYKPVLSGHIGFRQIFLPEVNKVSFDPFANSVCSSNKPNYSGL